MKITKTIRKQILNKKILIIILVLNNKLILYYIMENNNGYKLSNNNEENVSKIILILLKNSATKQRKYTGFQFNPAKDHGTKEEKEESSFDVKVTIFNSQKCDKSYILSNASEKEYVNEIASFAVVSNLWILAAVKIMDNA